MHISQKIKLTNLIQKSIANKCHGQSNLHRPTQNKQPSNAIPQYLGIEVFRNRLSTKYVHKRIKIH